MTAPTRGELVASQREVARRLGISHTALQKAVQSGRIAPEPDGRWDIDKTRRRLVETADPSRSPLGGSTTADSTPFARLKVAQLALKVEAQRLALDESKRRLIDIAEADATIDEVAGAMRDALLNWPARVAGVIAAELGVDPHLLQTILQQHVTDLLTEAADRFDPPGLGGDRGPDPIALAEAWARTFGWRRKTFLVSTPTIAGLSRIEREYLASDQRRFFVPCPHCGTMQVLTFERLRWEKGEPRSVAYRCEACDGAVEEHHKTAMLAGGEWRATAVAEDPHTVGFYISALYSPIGWPWMSISPGITMMPDPPILRVTSASRSTKSWPICWIAGCPRRTRRPPPYVDMP